MGYGEGDVIMTDAADACPLPPPELREVVSFPVTEASEAMAHLEEHGFVVFRSALSPAECTETVDQIWRYLADLGTGIRRGEPATYDAWPTSVGGSGILPYYGVGQCDAMWFARTRPGVRRAFEAVWRTDELICSYDGCCLFRPWRQPDGVREAWRTHGNWYHVDQHPAERPGFDCVQGLINLLPTTEASGGNTLLPGSHRAFGGLAAAHPAEVARLNEDFFPLPPTSALLCGGAAPLVPRLAAGDLLLWDSRTVHCSTPGSGEVAAGDAAELLRAAVFVCMVPRTRAPAEVLEARKAALARRATTTHRPHAFQDTALYDSYAAVPEAERRRFAVPADGGPPLTAAVARLVGYTEAEVQRLGLT